MTALKIMVLKKIGTSFQKKEKSKKSKENRLKKLKCQEIEYASYFLALLSKYTT